MDRALGYGPRGCGFDSRRVHQFKKQKIKEGVQKVFGTLDLFVSLLETEIKYPILQGGILPFWTPSFMAKGFPQSVNRRSIYGNAPAWAGYRQAVHVCVPRIQNTILRKRPH